MQGTLSIEHVGDAEVSMVHGSLALGPDLTRSGNEVLFEGEHGYICIYVFVYIFVYIYVCPPLVQ